MNNFMYEFLNEIYKSLTDPIFCFTLLLFYIISIYSESLVEIDTYARSLGVDIWKK